MFTKSLRRILNRLRGRNADAARAHLERGRTLSELGRHAEAAGAYQRALKLSPDDAEAHYRLGLAWRDQHRFDDAAASYRRALAIRPAYIEAHNNLGAVLQLQGNLSAALASYRVAVDLGPDFSHPYLNFGRLCEVLGDPPQATACYRRALERGVEPDVFSHLLNAVSGTASKRAPAGYVRNVFDEFAAHFDERLINELGYCIPELLADRVKKHAGGRKLRVLDLGCGTGLCGEHIGKCCDYLAGVDLSPAMLARARARNVYHELAERDIEEYLRDAPAASFDAVLSADVFIYIGDLAGVFSDVARVLNAGGVFALSIEQAPAGRDFTLQPNGRYAHSMDYIRRIAARPGLRVIEASPQRIRGGADGTAHGYVFVLLKP